MLHIIEIVINIKYKSFRAQPLENTFKASSPLLFYQTTFCYSCTAFTGPRANRTNYFCGSPCRTERQKCSGVDEVLY